MRWICGGTFRMGAEQTYPEEASVHTVTVSNFWMDEYVATNADSPPSSTPAAAYTAWAGKDLPTEAEWEFAARGGLGGAAFYWGNEFRPGDKYMGNTWQGQFPFQGLGADRFSARHPDEAEYPAACRATRAVPPKR